MPDILTITNMLSDKGDHPVEGLDGTNNNLGPVEGGAVETGSVVDDNTQDVEKKVRNDVRSVYIEPDYHC